MRSKIQISKKILSVFLCAPMLLSCVPMSAISASAEGASDITVAIDTGVEITIKDSDADGFYEIGTADELYAFAYAVNGGNTSINAELTANIVVNEGTMSAQTEGARAWIPIGNYENYYTGTFNGANYTISGLYFNDSYAYYTGLIGFLSTGGIVDYAGVTNSYFNGYRNVGSVVGENDGGTVRNSYSNSIVNGKGDVGGIAGYNNGTIDNCYNTGMISGDETVGGIAGLNQGSGIITNSYNTGNIKCEGKDYDYEGNVGGIVGTNYNIVENVYNLGEVSGGDYAGGIVGWNQFATITNSNNTGVINGERYVGGIAGDSNGTITNSNNTGDISGERCTGGIAGDGSGIMENNYNTGYVSGERYTGGIAGWNDGTINNSYNTGDVSGTIHNVGGIVGVNRETITNNYSTGDVFGKEYVGSVIGEHIAGTITNNYYLEDSETDDFDGTIFKKKAQFNSGEVAYLLQKEQTEEIWGQNIGTEELPVLGGDKVYYYKNCKNEDVYSNTNGSNGCNYKNGFCIYCDSYEEPALNGDYYEIDNAGKLYWFADKVNSGETTINAELTADIVVNEGVMSAETDSTSVRHWTPIGNYSQNKVIYSGIFAGNDKTISGLYFNNTETNYVGLIGGLDANGLVDYTGVKNSYFNAGDYVGSVVGWNEGTIETSYNTSEVSGDSFVGGVVGYNNGGTIETSYNTSEVSGIYDVGGVVGRNNGGTIETSYNTGEVSGTVDNVGGVAGSNRGGTIKTSYNTGKVSGAGDSVGGIAGLNSGGTIKTSYNTGEVNGIGNSVGGVVGLSITGIIESNYNIGKVSGTGNYVGGIVAYNDNSTITNNYYLADKETDNIDETTFKTKAQFKSGEVAYLLQEGVAEDEYGYKPSVWGQIIGTDDLPKLSEHTVYAGKNCKDEIEYTNIDTEYYDVILHSNFDEEGFCTDCKNGYKKPAIEIGENGWSMVYLISNAGELLWLQEFVNSGMAGDCSAKLMADINLNEGVIFNSDGTYTSSIEGATLRKWTPIDNMYGNFDGNGHTISGIYCVSEYDNVGLFGYDVSWNITNLTIENSYFKGNNNVGAISGYSENASYEGCVVKEDVTVKGNDYVGGISGYLSSSGQTANCMSLATIICTDGVYGGFAGSNSSAISNCYTTNEIFVGLHSTYYGNEFANCYYVSDIENEPYKGLSSISASAVTSGELAYRIQAGVKGEEIYDEESGEYVTAEPKQIWGQKLDEDKYPVLGGEKLYYGYKDCNATEMAYYNNNVYDEIPAHSFEMASVQSVVKT